ncbi:P-loop containing nucleoside triphosphate hydrolase protein [Paraphysoderma sedebokerense]|nr:P-loop containing nucleoside triphosphate hydrolase protein [Paraphysoderma sedebokerense]
MPKSNYTWTMNESISSNEHRQKNDNATDVEEPQYQLFFPSLADETKLSELERKELKKAGLPNWLANPILIPDENNDIEFSNESQTDIDDQLNTKKAAGDSSTSSLQNYGLASFLIGRCTDSGIDRLFPVQKAVIPRLIRHSFSPINPPKSLVYPPHNGDILVSAPTGSGKTLAYVLPIVHSLSSRMVTRLRCLVILPTRDLVMQVKETFDLFVKGTNLKVAAAGGTSSGKGFRVEQESIVGEIITDNRDSSGKREYLSTVYGGDALKGSEESRTLLGGKSAVDILITTPGRLIEHLRSTPNFTLQHLQYLVIDEADRLLNQSYQDWLSHVLEACSVSTLVSCPENSHYSHDAIHTPSLLFSPPPHYLPSRSINRVQKLLFSATLTRNPEKIASLRLHNPIYITVTSSQIDDSKYVLPKTLQEFVLPCSSTAEKPLMLLYLLYHYHSYLSRSNSSAFEHSESGGGLKATLCFTKSVESSRRLAKLVQLFIRQLNASSEFDNIPVDSVAEYSSDLSQSQRKQIMKQFRNGDIKILISSDLISRGIDLPKVSTVINYDTPTYIKQYIHRVGRTARAGTTGVAITLLANHEAKFFKTMMTKRMGNKESGNTSWAEIGIKKLKAEADVVGRFTDTYKVGFFLPASEFLFADLSIL